MFLGMIFLFILFLNINSALANEVLGEFKNIDKDSMEFKNNDIKELNDLLDQKLTLKNIPNTTISESERSHIRSRNPFSPAGSDSLNSKPGVNFKEVRFKGIATIGDTKVVFIETSQGTNSYQIGQIIGGGYTITNIDEKKLLVEITDQSTTHILEFEKDEN